jgi:hypothetical protein
VSFQQVMVPQPPSGRVDLDRVEAEAGQFVAGGWVREHVPGLVAELRAAYERITVLEAAMENLLLERRELGQALDQALDQAVSEP